MKVTKQYYNDAQMTDSNSLANALISRPESLSPVITHLAGREDKRFPLSFLTEGVGNTKSINNTEYEYRVQTRTTRARPIAETPDNTSGIGAGGSIFTLKFPDKWFIKDYVIISESGAQVRIMSDPIPKGSNYEYSLQMVTPGTTLPASDVQEGKLFAQMFAPVGQDFSRGNASNWASPALVRHKLSTLRKSYTFSGLAQDWVAEFDLPTTSGQTTKLWMDYEEYQKFLQWKEEMEMFLWYSEQSYTEGGAAQLKDENGQPIIIGPGIFQQVINKDSYSELTEDKLYDTIGDLFYGMTDAQNMNITLFTGTGGMREFDRAMKDYIKANVYTHSDDSKFISGSGRNLSLGGYFTQYNHVDGHTINVVKVPMFDHGPVAEARAKHPKSGYSLESYRMVFLDQSTYDGQNNLQMINKKGREMLRWAVPGSVVPKGFDKSTSRASDIDGASVHFLKQCGVCLRRFDTSLDLQCVAS